MYREINSPKVMACRAAYVLQVLCFFAGIFFGFSGLVNLHLPHAIISALCFTSGASLRMFGMKRLGFNQMEKLLNGGPYLQPGNDWGSTIIQLMEKFERLENEALEAAERQALRRDIVAQLKDDEKLQRYFRQRLSQRHPYMYNALG